jgi:hypothetical protein
LIRSPRTARGIPEIKFDYFLIVPIHPRLQGGAFSAPAGKKIEGSNVIRKICGTYSARGKRKST